MAEMKVKDIMAARVVTCKPNDSVHEAARKMRDEDIGSIVIVEGEKPVGIATREDITNKIAAKDLQPSKVQIKQIMNTPLIFCSPDDDIEDVAKTMTKYGYERLPVKRLNKLVGFVSVTDILRVAPGLFEIFKERLMIEEAPILKEETQSGECELCGNYSEELSEINDRWVCEACREEATEL